jgi:hypothetical protein
VGVVGGLLVLGGIAWAAFALFGGGDDPTPSSSPESSATPTPTADSGPITLPPVSLEVPATVEWTDSDVSCAVGDVLTITASGTVAHAPSPGATASPDGDPNPDLRVFNVAELPDSPHSGLIGRIDQSPPFFVGSNLEYVCEEAGELSLGVNDAGVANNDGAFAVTITQTTDPTP